MKTYTLLVLLPLALMCASCAQSSQNSSSAASAPTPTIAAVAIAPAPAAPTPTVNVLIQPVAPAASPLPTAAAGPTAEGAVPFAYLWPAYLPDGMRVSPGESRVARENEIGTNGTGFYLMTLNGENRKLVIGGGATDTLPLVGEAREVQYDGAPATLTVNGDQMQLVFTRARAKFFVYSKGISEQELMLVAESMLPTDIAALRAQVEAQ